MLQQQQQSKLFKTVLVGGPEGCGRLAVQELKGNWTEDALWPAEPECILPKFPFAGFVSFDPNATKGSNERLFILTRTHSMQIFREIPFVN